MARKERDYRHVSPWVWDDEKFIKLSPPQPNAQTLWFYMLFGPQTTPLPGLYRSSPRELAAALGWPMDVFEVCLEEITLMDMAWIDDQRRVIAVPNAPRYDPPASPNVVRYWFKLFSAVPDCDVKKRYLRRMQAFLRGFGRSFAEAFSKHHARPSPNPVPDPRSLVLDPGPKPEDQNQPPNPRAPKPRAPRSGRRLVDREYPPGFVKFWTAYPNKVGKDKCADLWESEGLERIADTLTAAVEAQKLWPPGQGLNRAMTDGGNAHPHTWLYQGRWKSEAPGMLTQAVNDFGPLEFSRIDGRMICPENGNLSDPRRT